MADLIAIHAEPEGEDIIEQLESWLALARDGKLSSVAVAVVYRDGSTGDGFSKIHSLGTQIGAVAVLQSRLISLITRKDAE